MSHTDIQTLVRIGRYDSSLEEAVKRFREPLTNVTVGLGNTVKYATFKEGEGSYLLMVSQQKDQLFTTLGYNVMLTVTSYSDLRNKEIAKILETEKEMNLDLSVSERLKKNCALIGLSFTVFEQNPNEAMAFLKGR